MVSFTALINRAHRRYIDKYLKRRQFGACEACDKRTLLVHLSTDGTEWDLCEDCYDKLVEDEIK